MAVNIIKFLIFVIAYQIISCTECPKKIKFSVNGFTDSSNTYYEEEVISPNENAVSVTLNENIPILCKGMVNVTKPTYYFYGEGRGIREIEAGTFENQNFQAHIQLSRNLLVVIRQGTFKNVNIRQLLLSDNQITTIEAGAIQDLPNLDVLNLSKNKIKEFHPNSLMNTPNMLLFDLSDNKIEQLEEKRFPFMTKEKETIFIISSNELRHIDAKAFEGIPISHFNVSDNKLESIPKELLSENKLTFLGIAHNKLTHLDDEFFEMDTTILRNVEVEGNNFDDETVRKLEPFLAIIEENKKHDQQDF